MEEMIYCDEHWHGYGAVGWRILTDLFSFLFLFLFILEEFRKRSSISTIFIRIITRIHLWLSHTNEKTRQVFIINLYVLIICLQKVRNTEEWIVIYGKLGAFFAYIELYYSGA